MASGSWLQDTMGRVRSEFLDRIPDQNRHEFEKFGTVEAVNEEIVRIQQEQSKTRTLKGLNRIQPYLKGLQDYFGVIDTFAQVKPDIACLVWGPLKLILQLANSAANTFIKLIDVLVEIGRTLPEFEQYARLGIFDANNAAKNVMGLFYADILDLHLEMFNFFKRKHLHIALEAAWPSFGRTLARIQGSIASHRDLITRDVTLEHVQSSFEERQRRATIDEENKVHRTLQNLSALERLLFAPEYENIFQDKVTTRSPHSGDWLFDSPGFVDWLQGKTLSDRCFWVRGIPGSGKTVLTANTIRRLQREDHIVLYAFLSHEQNASGAQLKVLESFMFQLVHEHRDLIDHVYEVFVNGSRTMKAVEQTKELFCDLATSNKPLILAVDGLDEIEKPYRRDLLQMLLAIQAKCDNCKLFISSRDEVDIKGLLREKAQSLKVDEHNTGEIEAYVKKRGEEWLCDIQGMGAEEEHCDAIRKALEDVVQKANGMFLYARLMLDLVRDEGDMNVIMSEFANLPHGIDEAYGRIVSRIKNNQNAKKTLGWIACAKRPLREPEINQALLIRPPTAEIPSQKKFWGRLEDICGPIIEIGKDGVVHFVHFTAKEYLLGSQSNGFLNIHNAHLEVATISLTYFCFKSFDPLFLPDITEDQRNSIHSLVSSGQLRLFPYVHTFWLDHMKELVSIPPTQKSKMEPVSAAGERFYEVRGQEDSEFDNTRARNFRAEFPVFEDASGLQDSLAGSAYFLNRLKHGQIVPTGEEWLREDPTMLCLATVRFQEALETAIHNCQDSAHSRCCCNDMRSWYGINIFRCRFRFCSSYHEGFPTSKERNAHESSTHKPKHLCSVPNCTYAATGFGSKSDLIAHMNDIHEGTGDRNIANEVDFDSLQDWKPDDLKELLEQAVLSDNKDLAKRLLSMLLDDRKASVNFDMLLHLATWKQHETMINIIAARWKGRLEKSPDSDASYLNGCLLLSVLLDLKVSARALINHGRMGIMRAVIDTGDFIWLRLVTQESGVTIDLEGLEVLSMGLAKDQNRFRDCVSSIRGSIPRSTWAKSLVGSVIRGHFAAVDMCLENGADPNSWSSKAPLYTAVREVEYYDVEDFVKIIKRLLEAGADPYPKEMKGSEPFLELKGLRKVEERLGLTWKEIVAEFSPDGQANDRMTGVDENTHS